MERVALADADSTEAVDGVHLSPLTGGEKTNAQHFEIDPGASVPAHSHPHEQTGYVVDGTLVFVLEDGEEIEVGPDDSFVIPGGETHAAENRGNVPVRGVDVFSPPREDPDWKE